jgi:hypothetical protein
MTIEQLKSLHERRPFQPFRIHLTDGRHLEVLHPEFLAQSPTGRTLILTQPDDTFEVVDLLLVTTLETINGQAKRSRRKGSNGR